MPAANGRRGTPFDLENVMSKEFQHPRTYPLRPRVWPWLVFALALAVVFGLGWWAFVATTGGA